jgi:AMMECR1 domain-containing protein
MIAGEKGCVKNSDKKILTLLTARKLQMSFLLIFSSVLWLFLNSCSQLEITSHFHDRHVLSYAPVADYSLQHGIKTLVLLDYHHDSGPGPDPGGEELSSYNWIGHLINQDIITRVYWVSGRNLQKQNRNARRAWLHRMWELDSPSEREKKEEAVRIVDWPELLTISRDWKKPFIVSLDLDVLTVDPGPDPDIFLNEILDFIKNEKPGLVTVALSAAYQKDAGKGWAWFNRTYNILSRLGPTFLELGSAKPKPESLEEAASWKKWFNRSSDANYAEGFAPGYGLWDYAPEVLFQNMIDRLPLPGDLGASYFVKSLSDAADDYKVLSECFSHKQLSDMLELAVAAILDGLKNPPVVDPITAFDFGEIEQGIIVRFQRNMEDRGCTALYRGVDDLTEAVRTAAISAAFFDPRYRSVSSEELDDLNCELCILGEFKIMSNPLDFIPGLYSLILEDDSNLTLLQSSIAKDRNLNRVGFLETLTRKAGLETGAWRGSGLHFYSAPTITVSGSAAR